MIKLVKFNLLIDGQRCRTIEDLRNNFNLLDLMEEYQSGKLEKWLKVRNFDKQFKLIKAIDKMADLQQTTQQLCSIFEVTIDEDDLKNELMLIEYNNFSKEQKEDQEAAKTLFNQYYKEHEEYLKSLKLSDTYPIKKIIFKQNVSTRFIEIISEDTRMILLGYSLDNETNSHGGLNGGTVFLYKDKLRKISCDKFSRTFNLSSKVYTMQGLSMRFGEKKSKSDMVIVYVIDIDNKLNSDTVKNATIELFT